MFMVHKIPASITIMYTIGVYECAWLFDVFFIVIIIPIVRNRNHKTELSTRTVTKNRNDISIIFK